MMSVMDLLYDVYELLPDVEMQEESRIVELIMQASAKMYNYKYYEKAVCLKVIKEHRAEMPSDYKFINRVVSQAYNAEDLLSIAELDEDYTATNEIIGLVASVTTTTDEDDVSTSSVDLKESSTISQLTNRAGSGWQVAYPGSDLMLKLQEEVTRLNESGCTDLTQTFTYCNHCKPLYSVDSMGRLVITVNTGLVLIEYLRIPRNEKGEYLVPYHPDMQDAINAYVLFKLFSKAFNQSKEGAQAKMQYWQQQWVVYHSSLKSDLKFPSLSEIVATIKNRSFFTLDSENVFDDAVRNPTLIL